MGLSSGCKPANPIPGPQARAKKIERCYPNPAKTLSPGGSWPAVSELRVG